MEELLDFNIEVIDNGKHLGVQGVKKQAEIVKKWL